MKYCVLHASKVLGSIPDHASTFGLPPPVDSAVNEYRLRLGVKSGQRGTDHPPALSRGHESMFSTDMPLRLNGKGPLYFTLHAAAGQLSHSCFNTCPRAIKTKAGAHDCTLQDAVGHHDLTLGQGQLGVQTGTSMISVSNNMLTALKKH